MPLRLAWAPMTLDERPTLLAIQHVPWEGPHRILDACGVLRVKTAKPLAGQPLPEAVAALGDEGEHALPERAAELEETLLERTAPGFEAFAEIVASG